MPVMVCKASETGYRRSHGEKHMDDCPCNLKSALEPSVWTVASPTIGEYAVRARLFVLPITGCAPQRVRRSHLPEMRERSARPGAKPTTYRFVGFSLEHGNLNWSAGDANPSKLPSPAMSPVGDGVSVVVGARESRVHGEGRQ